MTRRRADPEQARLKRQQRNQRYRADNVRREQEKEQDRLYKQEKREQARLRQHRVPLAQLADVIAQQEYLEVENDTINEAPIIGPVGEGEIIDADDRMEDGEVLENYGDHREGGFPDEIDSEMNDNDGGHWDGGFPDEVDSEMNDNGGGHWGGGFPDESDSEMNDNGGGQGDGGFPDEVDSEMNDNDSGHWGGASPDEADSEMNDNDDDRSDIDLDMNDDGSKSVINHLTIEFNMKEEDRVTPQFEDRAFIDLTIGDEEDREKLWFGLQSESEGYESSSTDASTENESLVSNEDHNDQDGINHYHVVLMNS
jgi:hypothetical protein